MNDISHLLAIADAYKAACDIDDVTISSRVFGDSKKLAALRGGADITITRFNAAIRWFSIHWPETGVWPTGIVRPDSASPSEQAA